MRLLMPGLPHTRTTIAFSHCAFSMKVRRWAPMMAPLGYECVHLGVGEPDSPGWAESVEVMSPALQTDLLGYDPAATGHKFIGDDANVGHACYQVFNRRLKALLEKMVRPDDWICLPFGHGHGAAIKGMEGQCIETGIGYPQCIVPYRVYESYGWLNWHLGRDNRHATVSEWVVPNYFDPDEWPLRPSAPREGAYVLYFGRIIESKGINVVWQLAKARPDLTFVLCGQGDATPWLTEPNLHYVPPAVGMGRAAMLHGAKCVLMPTQYVEPFGGVAVEAMMTGTPVLTSDHSAFPETNPCPDCRPHTLGDWLGALDKVIDRTDPERLRARTVGKYSLAAIGPEYDRVFRQLPAIKANGWNAQPDMPIEELAA
jgi:hypothetical protein